MLTHFSLCTGIGGIDLAAEWAGFKSVGQCELADFPHQVLMKHWPTVPKWRDIRDVTNESVRSAGIERIDLLSAGYPCQPFSFAGKRDGEADDRHLWPEVFRIIRETKPVWFLGENVAGHISSRWDSTLCYLTWKAKATPEGRLYFQLQVSVPRTSETEFSLWRTPAAANGSQGPKSKEFYELCLETGQSTITLTDQVRHSPGGHLWPTPQARDYRSADNPESPRIARKIEQGWSPNLNDAVKFWPTPKASLRGDCPSERERRTPDLHAAVKMWPTPKASDGMMGKTARTSGRPIEKSTHLQTQVHLAERKMWPTPRANDAEKRGNINAEDPRNGLPGAVKLWPTPQAGDEKDRGNLSNPCIQRRIEIGKQVNLSMCASETSGQLNPEWVECLMGFPAGWTDLSGPPQWDKSSTSGSRPE